jgi:phosphoglycolate phosphatase-like HAD superfamily hydrolase
MGSVTILFDIDGTLCDTYAVDGECFLRACSNILGIDVCGSDWTAAPQISDSGIVDWLWRQHRGRPIDPGEEQAAIQRFVDLLRVAFTNAPDRFRTIAGAAALLQKPPAGWRLAAATGGWRDSALFKLNAAGLPANSLAASSTDSRDRVDIFRLGAERARRHGDEECQIVLVGDGEWDVRVARALGWRFVGVGAGVQGERLHRAGACDVIRDFIDQSAFQAAVEASRVPE